jgi:multimeric flavodoxin WrbA
VVDKINQSDALVFGGGNYYGMLNAIGHAFWERTFALRHREAFPFAGKLGIAVGLDRDQEKREATSYIEKMMLSNKMAVIATFTDSGHQQCYDCGYGHNCVVGNVYIHQGLTTEELAEANRPEEYCAESQKKARAIGKMLGSIVTARKEREGT